MTDLTLAIYRDEDAAREHVEAARWPTGPYCPRCGEAEKIARLNGEAKGKGLLYCRSCDRKFTVTVGTLYERSHIPLHKWLLATHLMAASKKGMSAHQLHRMLGITYKSAWFMAHRIREAMREINPGPLGGRSKVVEADESYVGGKAANRKWTIPPKEAVFALVEREGKVRSHHVPDVSGKTLRTIIRHQVNRRSYLMTDESGSYIKAGRAFYGHGTVNHSIQEYVRAYFWHTNTAENYFSIFKRGIIGTYHHVSQKHLRRYLAEFDFRYNERTGLKVSDDERAAKALRGITGKRLTYRRTREQSGPEAIGGA